MERFPETTFSNAALAHKRGDDDASYSLVVNTCESCGQTTQRLSTMPAYQLSPALQACDQCMAEDEAARGPVAFAEVHGLDVATLIAEFNTMWDLRKTA